MGLIDEVLSCEELCDGIVEEAEFIIRSRLAKTIVDFWRKLTISNEN